MRGSGKLEGSALNPQGHAGQAIGEGQRLLAAKRAARQRYEIIAEALKREAGVTRHYTHNFIGGLAWSDQGRILAPQGITRRQLYVLAHECGHVLLHGTPEGMRKPAHVKEHEAEVYAHRAFKRYGLEVPDKSAQWARAYVGLWIMKDKVAGVPICKMAADFALNARSPHDPLPSIDGQPTNDFSKSLERFIAKGQRIAEQQEAKLSPSDDTRVPTLRPVQTVYLTPEEQRRLERNPDDLPIACGTCRYKGYEYCRVHLNRLEDAWRYTCKGESWRPRRKFILTRVIDALLKRFAERR